MMRMRRFGSRLPVPVGSIRILKRVRSCITQSDSFAVFDISNTRCCEDLRLVPSWSSPVAPPLRRDLSRKGVRPAAFSSDSSRCARAESALLYEMNTLYRKSSAMPPPDIQLWWNGGSIQREISRRYAAESVKYCIAVSDRKSVV